MKKFLDRTKEFIGYIACSILFLYLFILIVGGALAPLTFLILMIFQLCKLVVVPVWIYLSLLGLSSNLIAILIVIPSGEETKN